VVNIGDTIKRRRAELGMSQADLAKASDINLRQVRRYESDEQQPAIGVAVRLARALGVTIGELAGEESALPRLAGEWWAAWQTYIDGVETITTQPVAIQQTGATLQIKALALAEQEHAGDYLWRGELRLWGSDTLMGWYIATDENVRSKGTMFFVLHTQGERAAGRWVGTSYDGPVVTGAAALARDHDQLLRIFENRPHLTEQETR
jgi:transcriptional regulator with XRE-family HTH domain